MSPLVAPTLRAGARAEGVRFALGFTSQDDIWLEGRKGNAPPHSCFMLLPTQGSFRPRCVFRFSREKNKSVDFSIHKMTCSAKLIATIFCLQGVTALSKDEGATSR